MNTLYLYNNSLDSTISNVTGAPSLSGISFPVTYEQSGVGTFDNGALDIFTNISVAPSKLSMLQFVNNGFINKTTIVQPGTTGSIETSFGSLSNTDETSIITFTDDFYAITQQPAGNEQYLASLTCTLRSANNFSYYTVLSSNCNQTDFQYKADVYINDSTDKAVTLTDYPDPIQGYGTLDLSRIANKYVSYDFSNDVNNDYQLIQSAPNSSCKLQVKFREQYTDGSTFVNPSGTTDSNPVYYLNSSLPFKDSVLTTPQVNQYLTTWPKTSNSNYYSYRSKKQSKAERAWLYFFNDSTNPVTYIHYVTYDSDGEQIGHYTIANPYAANNQVVIITTGYFPLQFAYGFTVVSGPSTIINQYVSSFDVVLSNDPVEYQTSNAFDAFHIEPFESCTIFTKENPSETYSIYWLNEMGGFSSWNMPYKNLGTITKNQVAYKKVQGKLTPANGIYQVSTYEPSTINYYTELTTVIQMNSGFLSDTDVNYLKGLFSSPMVFFENGDFIPLAATISDNSYSLKRIINSSPRAFSLQFNLNVSASDYRQLL